MLTTARSDCGCAPRACPAACRKTTSTKVSASLSSRFRNTKTARTIGAGRLQRIAEIFEVPVAALFGASRREGRAGVDPFEGLRTPGAVQLLEAYGRIGDRVIRRAFLRFAEQVAVTSQRSSRR